MATLWHSYKAVATPTRRLAEKDVARVFSGNEEMRLVLEQKGAGRF